MINYNAFKKVFLTKSNSILVSTIKNSEARHARYEASGKERSAAMEIERIQAAADTLDERGYYDVKPSARSPKAGGIGIAKGGIMLAAGLLAVLLLS